jgi:hypothetical protein
MDNVEVSEGSVQTHLGITPNHKISVSQGGDTYIYWYVRQDESCRTFSKSNDMDLVEFMHAKASSLRLNGFESFQLNRKKDYHLQRVSEREFVVKAMN